MINFIRRGFTQVPNELINDASISRDARFLFVWLCSKPDNWKFYNDGVNVAMGCKDDSRRKYMKELADKGWISILQERAPGGSWGPNNITLNPFPTFTAPENFRDGKNTDAEKDGDGKNPTLNNTGDINNTKKKKDNNTGNSLPLFQSDAEVAGLDVQVLNYLNEKKGGRAFETTSGNLSDIKARIKEKTYSLEDFKKVIDFKVYHWGKDRKLKSYLRPKTLFNGKNFNGYLIEAEESKVNVHSSGSLNYKHEPQETPDLA